MKHAKLDSFGHVLHVYDAPAPTTREVTDEQAATIAVGRKAVPPVLYVLRDSTLITREQALAERRDAIRAAARAANPRKVTKLTLMRRLDTLGKWGTFKAVLASMPELVQDAWNLAQEISESDPMFAANRAAIAAALGLTEEEVMALFV